jgi:hypothetical protein
VISAAVDIRVQAQCADNGPFWEIRVKTEAGVVALAQGTIDTLVGLREGSNSIVITATDRPRFPPPSFPV